MKLTIFLSIIGILFVFCETAGAKFSKCDRWGTEESKHNTNEECKCKANVMGQTCDQCKPNTFDLFYYNPLGCTQCFCMGITDECQSLNWPKEVITELLTISGQKNLDNDFVLLPEKFLKNQLLSYGQILILTIELIKTVDFVEPIEEADIEIFSETQDMTLSHRYTSPLSESFSEKSYIEKVVYLHESHWYLADKSQIPRNQFLMVLADITAIKIRIEYGILRCAISKVELQTAAENGNGKISVYSVEKCDCPAGYTGTSCEKCALGYTRISVEPYLGKCGPMCNGHAHKWDENTQSCVNCAHNTAGKYCHLCAPGYQGDATTERGCELPSGPSSFPLPPPSECNCNSAGSKNYQCNGDCICKDNVEGERCDRCKPSTFGLSAENDYGCNKCFCSGVTDQCHESSYYYQTISFGDTSSSLKIFDTETGKLMNDDMEIGYWIPKDMTAERFTLVLPSIYYGNRARSYGGYLTLNVEFGGALDMINPTAIITFFGDGIELLHGPIPISLTYGESSILSIPLIDFYWRVPTEDRRQATREDFMRVLLNLEEISVIGPIAEGLEIIYLRSISMDEARTDYFPGLNPTTQIEICECPRGYSGESCETCSPNYYRDIRDKTVSLFGACEPCPCSGHWKGCELSGTGEIMCLCEDGYSGDDCKAEWQLSVNMRVEPERQTVEPGGVATMTCAVDFRDADDEADFLDHEKPALYSQVHLQWIREDNEPLPFRSTISDGILTIYNVDREDTGVYVCRGLKDDEVEFIWAKSYLHVGIPPLITLNPNDETVDLGDDVSIVCHAFGDPPMTIVWTAMYRDLLPGEVDDGYGRLTFIGIATTDVGRYVCNATNAAGTASAVAQVLTTLPECF